MEIDRAKLKAALKEVRDARTGKLLGPHPDVWAEYYAHQCSWTEPRTPEHEAWHVAWRQRRDAQLAWTARFNADRATALYALAASLRGRIHVKRRWVTCAVAGHVPCADARGGLHLIECGKDYQDKLVELVAKEFQCAEAAAGAAPPVQS